MDNILGSKKWLALKELAGRFHRHDLTMEEASKVKTGVLDVALLQDALLSVHPTLLTCTVVALQLAAITWNQALGRKEVVFHVKDAHGEYLGSYFASAFISLKR